MKSNTKSCTICSKVCRINQSFATCNRCRHRSHIKCISRQTGKVPSLKNRASYKCFRCQNPDQASSSDANSNILSNTPPDLLGRYTSLSELNCKITEHSSKDLFILHLNTVSLTDKMDDIQILIRQLQNPPDIICVSETKLHEKKIDWQLNWVKLKNFTFVSHNSITDAGGVGIYIYQTSCITRLNLTYNLILLTVNQSSLNWNSNHL